MFQRENIPTSVKMAAAANLLFAVFHLASFVYFVPTMPIAWGGLVKMLFAIAAAIGLLKLRPGWRTFTVFISWLGVLILPFYVLATIFSTAFMRYVFEISGIDSRAIMLSMESFGFAMFLFILICLTRPDAKKAFESVGQQSGEQATLAS